MCAVLIGVALGLMGGGGSILTVPILVYLLGIPPLQATSYSLFVVGVSSLVGALGYATRGLVSYKTAVVFGIPTVGTVYAVRKFLLPMVPENLATIGGMVITRDLAVMILFAALMITAAWFMLRDKKQDIVIGEEQKFNYPLILLDGLAVGLLTGLVGAGGGFLIVPALVILSRLPMKLAVGTSLLIITVKSLVGFAGDMGNFEIDWMLLGAFSVLAVVGILIGNSLSKYISGERLKPGFGWFVLVMGTCIILAEILRR